MTSSSLASKSQRGPRRRIIPGFGLSLGVTLFYLTFILFVPLAALILHASGIGWAGLWEAVSSPSAVASYQLTIAASAAAALTNTVFGILIAWVLVRYSFPLKKLFDTIVDLPFALPSAVGGLALAALFAQNGWIGGLFASTDIQLAYSQAGVVIALIFTGIPFVVRSVQPVLENLEPAHEEAALLLGATRIQTFWRVIFPTIFPAVLTGFTLAFARGLGEYGAVIFVSSNIPFETEVTSRLIYGKLEQYDIVGATAVASVTLIVSFFLLLAFNVLQSWQRKGERRS